MGRKCTKSTVTKSRLLAQQCGPPSLASELIGINEFSSHNGENIHISTYPHIHISTYPHIVKCSGSPDAGDEGGEKKNR